MRTVNDEIHAEDFAVVQRLIYDYAGIALSDAKRVMVHSRLAKRLRALGLVSYGAYLELLQGPRGTEERIQFINCLTTNKTDFFRENHHFEFLQQQVFPAFGRHGKLRIWSAACSSGEEPYSIAMCVRESFSEHADTLILATDIDTTVLARASSGIYRHDQVSGVSPTRLNRFFEKTKDGRDTSYCVKKCLSEIVKFGRLNFSDRQWPISQRFDIIFCRNAMIYFNPQTQRKLVERFATLINPGGYLIIGHSESLHGASDIFEPLGKTIYRLKSASGKSVVVTGLPKPVTTMTVSPAAATPNTTTEATTSHIVAKTVRRNHTPVRTAYASCGECDKVSIIVGQSHVSNKPTWVTTVLGSCISACIYDDVARLGGVNHFMLPSSEYGERICGSYGVHAMEILINDLMKRGAQRSRLKAKLFGGGTVVDKLKQLDNVGERNIHFARNFLANESIPLVAAKVGGNQAMYLRFHTTTFEAQVRPLSSQTSVKVVTAESQCAAKIKPKFGSVTLL